MACPAHSEPILRTVPVKAAVSAAEGDAAQEAGTEADLAPVAAAAWAEARAESEEAAPAPGTGQTRDLPEADHLHRCRCYTSLGPVIRKLRERIM